MLAEWTESKCKNHGWTAQVWAVGCSEFLIITSMDVQFLGRACPALGAGVSPSPAKSSSVSWASRAKSDSAGPGRAWCHNTLQEAAEQPCTAKPSRDPQPWGAAVPQHPEEQQSLLWMLHSQSWMPAPTGVCYVQCHFFKLAPKCQPNT